MRCRNSDGSLGFALIGRWKQVGHLQLAQLQVLTIRPTQQRRATKVEIRDYEKNARKKTT